MRTIAFVTQKGGSGKSTLASSVAVSAAEAGERVFIIDMDPLGTLINWSKAREDSDIPVVAVTPDKLRRVLTALEKEGATLVIIDTPGTDADSIKAAAKVADLAIVPARPNVFDLWASDKTRTIVKSLDREFVFLLNQCPPAQQSARVEQGSKALEALGGLLTPLVSSRVDFQEAARYGLGVTEYNPSGVAAEEIKALWASIKRRLAKSGKPSVRKAA
jgi:chromosome partitioning protein